MDDSAIKKNVMNMASDNKCWTMKTKSLKDGSIYIEREREKEDVRTVVHEQHWFINGADLHKGDLDPIADITNQLVLIS